jgi:hypothetical protein
LFSEITIITIPVADRNTGAYLCEEKVRDLTTVFILMPEKCGCYFLVLLFVLVNIAVIFQKQKSFLKIIDGRQLIFRNELIASSCFFSHDPFTSLFSDKWLSFPS